ncbi:NIF domain-containing protein [Histoplasma ohiense]|nr:NIF domain-containing protein [Histoplasma ohiense (nom. inval.)]
MNSLNILSSRVIRQPSSSNPRPRSRSQGPALSGSTRSDLAAGRSYSEGKLHIAESVSAQLLGEIRHHTDENDDSLDLPDTVDEKSPLLQDLQTGGILPATSKLQLIAQRLFDAIAETLKVILSALASPGIYVARAFRDDAGHYSVLTPVKRLGRLTGGPNRTMTAAHGIGIPASGRNDSPGTDKPLGGGGRNIRRLRSSTSRESMSSNTSESEPDRHGSKHSNGGARRSKSTRNSSSTDDGTPRRSIRIKLNTESNSKRKHQKVKTDTLRQDSESRAAETLKSPMSPSSHKLTKYPHAPSPPRPLIPLRQPSYTPPCNPRYGPSAQKTLVLDLDETLIHSLAKGGRMSSGHMVEVKLSTPVTTSTPEGSATTIGPQHPILYYVHKRPHCDEFLRKVCKWYKLVVFTASVQEYADPVIDWLEQERKYFHRRYYRQHCTLRNGAYIKDLSSVEPDLSKVMILDNSPMSYIFHEDNAIPIEGWINDPTDNDLLHLIPILEALQYVTDVRALLALRRGEAEAQ